MNRAGLGMIHDLKNCVPSMPSMTQFPVVLFGGSQDLIIALAVEHEAKLSMPREPQDSPCIRLGHDKFYRRQKQLGTLRHQLDGVKAAAKALGDSTNRGITGVKKRVLSAAARAKMSKAAKKRWAKIRAQAKKVVG